MDVVTVCIDGECQHGLVFTRPLKAGTLLGNIKWNTIHLTLPQLHEFYRSDGPAGGSNGVCAPYAYPVGAGLVCDAVTKRCAAAVPFGIMIAP